MIKIILPILMVAFSLPAFSAELTTADMKKLVGKFANKAGDKMEVSLTYEEVDDEQPSLFGPEIENFQIDLSMAGHISDGSDRFELDEDDFEGKEKDGSYVFSDIQDDCDNPGCGDYWLYISFIPKKKGAYSIYVNGEVSIDMDEDFYIEFGEGAHVTDEEATKFCTDYYSDQPFIKNVVGYGDYARCDYDFEFELSPEKKKKVKKSKKKTKKK